MNKQKKIKVLQAIRQGIIGGGESHVLDLVKHINKDIFEPIVLSFTDGPMIENLDSIGIKNRVIHTEKAFDFRKWQTVKTFIESEQIDLIHAHGTRANTNLFWVANKLNIPLIYTVHGWSFHNDQNLLVKYLRIKIEQFLCLKSNVTISVSKSNKSTGKKYFPSFEPSVVNNGIDLKKFSALNQLKDLKNDIGINNELTIVGCIMRLTKQKDPLTLIRAFAECTKKIKNLHLLIVGDGELKSKAIELANNLKISDKVTFLGYRQDIPDILNIIDIYCLPSLWEGFPIGLLEAMAMGKAVIATNVDGSKEIIQNSENGILIEPMDINALVKAISELAINITFRRNIENCAKFTVRSKFEVNGMTKKIEEIYLDHYSN